MDFNKYNLENAVAGEGKKKYLITKLNVCVANKKVK
jgi:hypothetical protein